MTVSGAISADLAGWPEPWTVIAYDTVVSTMEEARRLAADGAADRTAVRAVSQSGGRGRLGRPWTSPPGNVYTTVILRPGIPTARAAELSLVAAVAMADAIAAFAGPVSLKWPNDVLLGGAKVSGVLLEAIAAGASLSAVLVGIGINVASRPRLPDRPTARVAGAYADAVFAALLEALDRRYEQWRRDGMAGIRAAWLARGPALDSAMTVGQGQDRIEGGFAGLESDGRLRIRLADGTVRSVASGEVLA